MGAGTKTPPASGGNGAGSPADAKDAVSAVVAPAQARRERARAQIASAPARQDATATYTLSKGEQWYDLPNGGKVGIAVAPSSGIESVIEITSQGRARKGASIAALDVLMEAGRL